MSDRPSWYTCAVCKVPYTTEAPLVWVAVKGDRRAKWNIHPACQPELEATLVDGVTLEPLR